MHPLRMYGACLHFHRIKSLCCCVSPRDGRDRLSAVASSTTTTEERVPKKDGTTTVIVLSGSSFSSTRCFKNRPTCCSASLGNLHRCKKTERCERPSAEKRCTAACAKPNKAVFTEIITSRGGKGFSLIFPRRTRAELCILGRQTLSLCLIRPTV